MIIVLILVVVLIIWISWPRPTPVRKEPVPTPVRKEQVPTPVRKEPVRNVVAPPASADWVCALDFGTTYSKASWAQAGYEPVVVHFGSAGGFPSAVGILSGGGLVVGQEAINYGFAGWTRIEPNPKRWVGQQTVPLIDQAGRLSHIPVEDIVAAVLGKAYTAAPGEAPSGAPREVMLTHPAAWTGTPWVDGLVRAWTASCSELTSRGSSVVAIT